MRYTVYFRGENEHEWKLLKENLEQKFYSWDTTALPDGAYYLKIVATDAPSNPPALALKTERESERFEGDNTPPLLKIQVIISDSAMPNTKLTLAHFTALSPTRSIDRPHYQYHPAPWLLVT